MKLFRLLLLTGFMVLARAQEIPGNLPAITVNSPRIANQTPVGTFSMPISALRFEPQVDLQARNLAEGQADVTIRGGIFENTGFGIGAISLSDPQTGHYYGELPVAVFMLGAPAIITGPEHALTTFNSTVGAVKYQWRPVSNLGLATLTVGTNQMLSTDIYQGRISTTPVLGGLRLSADIAWAQSTSDGSIRFGDHHFTRANARVQLTSACSQTDLFAGYQAKFFGWSNLYTPFNSAESENLETVLIALNHRRELGAGDFVEAGVYHRRNKDDYAFNRFAPVGSVHPFQHTTWVSGAAVGGRHALGELAAEFRGEVVADELKSTSLVFGRYRTRTIGKLAFALGKIWELRDTGAFSAKVGATYDDSNHGGGTLMPVLELSREWRGSAPMRLYAAYSGSSQLPSYTALNSNPSGGLFRGNANLGREKSRNAELGITTAAAGWAAQAALFFRQDDRLVDWTFRRGVTARSANAVDTQTTGFEVVARRSWNRVELILGYTALTKDSDYRGAAVDASFYAFNYARHRLTAALIYRFATEWELRLDNVARVQADNLLRAVGGDETLLGSAGIFFRPRAWRGLTVSLQADNVWNSNYQEVPAVPAARRQIALGVSYAW